MSLSNYAEEKLLKHIFGIAGYTAPTNFHLGLSTADPTDTGSGAAEPSGNGYARTLHNGWAWDATDKRIEQGGTITFPTATGSWGTITHVGVWDASTAGNLLASWAMPTAKAYANTDVASFAAGEIVFPMTGHATEYLREKLLKHLFNIAAYTAPSIYIYLSTANPGSTGSGIAEPGSAYERQLVSAANWTWNAGQERVENVGVVTFPTPTGSWGTINYSGLADAVTAGNVLVGAPVTAAKAYSTGDVADYPAGDFSFALD